ncbi:MAG: hypothetical protein V1867_08245 [Candidatus Falkowbacteria bacterium]
MGLLFFKQLGLCHWIGISFILPGFGIGVWPKLKKFEDLGYFLLTVGICMLAISTK